MVQQVTKGIKISISSGFEGKHYQKSQMYFTFTYSITIENQSNDTVQLLSRHWNIFDSLNQTEEIEGEGVIGEKPILNPNQSYTYSSHCLISSPMGSMNGFYKMLNFTTAKEFNVQIPTFQLMVPATMN